jgi:hypothetical protein
MPAFRIAWVAAAAPSWSGVFGAPSDLWAMARPIPTIATLEPISVRMRTRPNPGLAAANLRASGASDAASGSSV